MVRVLGVLLSCVFVLPPSPANAAWPVDGTWSAVTDGLGGDMTLELLTRGTAVSGHGQYRVGATRRGAVSVRGHYRPPALTLTITYDHGEVVTLSAQVVGSERMTGSLVWKSGTELSVTFVRP